MKTYVTFGQEHIHMIGGKIFDHDCVCEIECDTPEHGREIAFRLFGQKFCFEYPNKLPDGSLKFFPRGIIPV